MVAPAAAQEQRGEREGWCGLGRGNAGVPSPRRGELRPPRLAELRRRRCEAPAARRPARAPPAWSAKWLFLLVSIGQLGFEFVFWANLFSQYIWPVTELTPV